MESLVKRSRSGQALPRPPWQGSDVDIAPDDLVPAPEVGRQARPRRIFSTPRGRRRYRRATDVMLLVPAVLLLGAIVLAYPPERFERALAAFLDSFPAWLEPVWTAFYGTLIVWAVGLLVAALVTRRLIVVGAAVAAGLLALAFAALAARLALGSWPAAEDVLRLRTGEGSFSVLALGAVAAIGLVVHPYLIRPMQRLGRWVLVLGFVGALLTEEAPASATLAAFAVAVAAATAVRLVLGTSAGHPESEAVVAALLELGVPVESLQPASRQPAGVFVARGVSADGSPLGVKVYGRDAYDTQLLEKAWRTVMYADDGPRTQLSRVEAVEHEALATLLAAGAGVPVPEVVLAAEASTGDALLVLREARRPLGGLPHDAIDVVGARGRLGGGARARRRRDRAPPARPGDGRAARRTASGSSSSTARRSPLPRSSDSATGRSCSRRPRPSPAPSARSPPPRRRSARTAWPGSSRSCSLRRSARRCAALSRPRRSTWTTFAPPRPRSSAQSRRSSSASAGSPGAPSSRSGCSPSRSRPSSAPRAVSTSASCAAPSTTPSGAGSRSARSSRSSHGSRRPSRPSAPCPPGSRTSRCT